MMNIFLDCGSNIGQGYSHFRQKYRDDYRYILFEPNPYCYAELLEKFGNVDNVEIRNEAIFSEDCCKTFSFGEKYSVGGSIIKNHNSLYNKINQNQLSVRCIDIVQLINGFSANDNIVIKLDIESSEYDVLEHMIKTETIFKVKKIYCEFHSQYMNKEDKSSFKKRENNILDFMRDHGINFEIWR